SPRRPDRPPEIVERQRRLLGDVAGLDRAILADRNLRGVENTIGGGCPLDGHPFRRQVRLHGLAHPSPPFSAIQYLRMGADRAASLSPSVHQKSRGFTSSIVFALVNPSIETHDNNAWIRSPGSSM